MKLTLIVFEIALQMNMNSFIKPNNMKNDVISKYIYFHSLFLQTLISHHIFNNLHFTQNYSNKFQFYINL